MSEGVLLTLALLSSATGLSWLALAMETHWKQVHTTPAPGRGKTRLLRLLGCLALLVSLSLCLSVDHPSMAALVWIMTLALSALMIALVLAWRPGLLRLLPVGARQACSG